MKKNFNLLTSLLALICITFYFSCNVGDEIREHQSLDYDLSKEADRAAYLDEIRENLISEYNWEVMSATVGERDHHCPPETSQNEMCETFTGPVRIYLTEEFTSSLGLPFNPDCFVTGRIEVTFCITPQGIEISWTYRGASIIWADCPEIRDFLSTLSDDERWDIIRAIFDYGKDNYEEGFFQEWIGNQADRFDCDDESYSYVLESADWTPKCEGLCVFWNQETNEIESKQVACGEGCCATVTTWCWDSETQQVVSTEGVNLVIDGECSASPNETCDGWLISCSETEACQ